MRKLLKVFFKSGVWMSILIFVVGYGYLYINYRAWIQDSNNMLLLALGSALPCMFVLLSSVGTPNADLAITGKQVAMYKPIDRRLLFKTPTGVILGKDIKTGKYICRPSNVDGHVLIIGGSGSGKSSCFIIPTLLLNQMIVFAIDIKGELHEKATQLGDKFIRIFEPLNRESWGYDPFFLLNEKSSNQEIYEVMVNIANSLVPIPPNLSETFWKTQPRNLMAGLMMYFYKNGSTSFVDVIDKILGAPIADVIAEVIENSNPNTNEYRYTIPFYGMAPETLYGIAAEVTQHLQVFVNDQNLRYAFKDNPNKVNPTMLEDKISIYVSVPEYKLAAWYDMFQLILNQTLMELSKRPENSHPILVVIDEMPRLLSAGKLDMFLDACHTIRSRQVCLMMVTQATESLMSAYSENEVSDIMSNCMYRIALSGSSEKTEKPIIRAFGKYRQKKKSWNGTGDKTSISTSFEDKEILEPSDMQQLMLKEEAVIITPYGGYVSKKVPYYKDRYFQPLADEIKRNNVNLLNSKKEE